jgi:hypothetical protein
MRLLTYLYKQNNPDEAVGYGWVYLNRDLCQTLVHRMEMFRQVVKQDASLRSLAFDCEGDLDPVVEFFLSDPIEELDSFLSAGACIFPVASHIAPLEQFAACIDEDSRVDDQIEEMMLDDEMELRTFSHLGEADTVLVMRTACQFVGRPSGAEFPYITSPIGRDLIVECKNMAPSEPLPVGQQMDVVDYFHSEMKECIRRIWHSDKRTDSDS